jgi:hypothetical protein
MPLPTQIPDGPEKGDCVIGVRSAATATYHSLVLFHFSNNEMVHRRIKTGSPLLRRLARAVLGEGKDLLAGSHCTYQTLKIGKWYKETYRGAAMKAKKALKRLSKVEAILSDVIDQYASREHDMRQMLDTAKASVVRAKAKVSMEAPAKLAKKPPLKAQEPGRHLTAEGRKRLSLAAKKRWAIAKRKGISAITGQPLNKTA